MSVAISLGPAKAAEMAGAEVRNMAGKIVGIAVFEQTQAGVLITLEVGDLPAGVHAVHLHGVGACTPDFKAAGGHINPSNASHGMKNAKGPDNGDLPNMFVGKNGSAVVQFLTPWVTVRTQPVPLLDSNGSTLIIHASADDHATQPIGGAGDRIACGIVKPK